MSGGEYDDEEEEEEVVAVADEGKYEEEDSSRLLSLPLDPLLTLLSFLDPKDLLQLASSCTFLRRVAHSDCLWMSLCGLYKNLVDLPTWRSRLDSAAALFRLLSSFSRFVGLWTAKGQEPRGSLLYVTWVYTRPDTYIHTYIHIHTYIYTYIHTYIHTCMHACMLACMLAFFYLCFVFG